jgi:hypothetical protein
MRMGLPAIALVTLVTACGSTRTVVRTVTVVRQPPPSATGDQRYIGRIVSMERSGDNYLLQFDPTWFLSGVTANIAQAEDQGTKCAPLACPPVDNDNYRVDEGHRVLTFIIPATTKGTVLVRKGQNGGPFPTTTITADGLAKLVAGKSSLKLFEPLTSGVWILVHIDTVHTFAQQYVP